MDELFKQVLIYLIFPSVLLGGGYLIRSLLNRLNALENSNDTKVTEVQVRQILADKIDPLRNTMDDIRFRLDKIYDLLLKK